MAGKKDYYKILGITDEEKKLQGDAFNNVLKKKYKKLCLKWHPDRHVNDSDEDKKVAEDMFKDINEANAILSDAQKRNQYDNGGDDLYDFFSHFNAGDMGGSPFSSFFHGGGFDFGGAGGFGGSNVSKGDDASVEVTISMQESYTGTKKTVWFNRNVACNHCNGTGSEDGQTHACPVCGGSGRVAKGERRGNMFMQQIITCEHCHGTGKEVTSTCKECDGTGLKSKYVKETIEIPGGIGDGMQFSINGLGDEGIGGQHNIPGDLIVTVRVVNDGYFERPDLVNVIHTEEVPFNEALLGKNIKCKTLDGSEVNITIPECCEDGKVFVFKGKGMPDVTGRNRGVPGDYAVIIKHKVPTKLTDKQKEMLKNFNNLK